MWHDDALYFSTGPTEQKAKNVGRNAHCILTTGCNRLDSGLDVVVEGIAVRVADEARLGALADAWQAKYGSDWPLTGTGDAADLVLRVAPMRAFGFRKGFGEGGQGCQTRWRWHHG
jgi:hypothetical protein